MTPRRYQELQDNVNKKRQQLDRATGALEQVSRSIKEQWKCKSVEDAEKLLTKMEKEEAKLHQEADELADAYDKDFPED